jgi:hypothetical protein
MGAGASCHTARAILYTIDGQIVSLSAQTPHTHQLCRPAEVTFHCLGTQAPKSVRPNHGGRYTIVRGDAGPF